MKSINIEKREYKILLDKINSNEDLCIENKYILNSLKDIIENKESKKIYIISKVSGRQLNARKDNPYNVNEVNIRYKSKNIFIYDMADNAPKEMNIIGISENYKDDIVFFEIGVFADLFLFLYADNNINIKKMIKKIQSYYDKSVLPAYRINSKSDSNVKLIYSKEHFNILKKIHDFESLKLDLKQIEDILFNLKTTYSYKEYDKEEKKIIRIKIIEKRIKLIKEIVESYEAEELERNISKILFSLDESNYRSIKMSDIIELILSYPRKKIISVYDDKTFYYLIFKIKYLFFENKNPFSKIVSPVEGDRAEDYNIILKLYLDSYKEMKEKNKESLYRDYNNEEYTKYGYDNLNHDDYLVNEERLNEINILNTVYCFENLFLRLDFYEYHYRQDLSDIYKLRNKYHEYMDLLFYLLELRINCNIQIRYKNNEDKIDNDIISILEDINTVQKIAERFYFLGYFNDDKYLNYELTIRNTINNIKIGFAFKYIEEIKSCINNKKYKEYYEAFNHIIEFIDFAKENRLKKSFILISEKHYDKDFNADDNDLKIIEEARNNFVESGINFGYYTYGSFNESAYQDRNKIKENYKRDREIFFENNYKIIYERAKKDGIIKMNYIKSNNIKEGESYFIYIYFLNYMNYIYQKKYYIDFFKINKIDLKKFYIERADIFEEPDVNFWPD